jgi:hypothetical protein
MGVADSAAWAVSRRAFLQALTAVPLTGKAGAASAPGLDRPDPFGWTADRTPQLDLQQRYRVDAQVMLLGMPLLHRESVGAGHVVWREFDVGAIARLIEFSGYSRSDRACGLNRLGLIREMTHVYANGGSECAYFGLMTAAGEQTAEEARRALHTAASEQTYLAVDGRIAAGETETVTAGFTAPAWLSGDSREELIARARRALAQARMTAGGAAGSGSSSFLQMLGQLLMRPDCQEGRYSYCGRPYRLRLTRVADPRATAHFRERKLVEGATQVLRVTGRTQREAGGPATDFRLWVASRGQRPLPLRIEYQARPYLRLTFEAESA